MSMDKKHDKTIKQNVNKDSLQQSVGNIYPDKTIRFDSAKFQHMAAPVLKGSLLVISGSQSDIGNHMLVDYPVVIGRDLADLTLHDGRISRRHVMVEPSDGRYFVKDLGSTNGTCLNGKILTERTELREGDKILLGQSVVKFMLVDQTEAEYLRDMQHQAGIDQLTGLPAKHRFDALLQEAIGTAQAMEFSLSVMMMDMDGLKSINDAHGHQMGAHTISMVGRIIGRALKGKGEACRFGGDEFCAMLPKRPLADALAIGEQIRREVEETAYSLKGITVRATISIGVAELTESTATEHDLLAHADKALYRSKAKGRNNVSE